MSRVVTSSSAVCSYTMTEEVLKELELRGRADLVRFMVTVQPGDLVCLKGLGKVALAEVTGVEPHGQLAEDSTLSVALVRYLTDDEIKMMKKEV